MFRHLMDACKQRASALITKMVKMINWSFLFKHLMEQSPCKLYFNARAFNLNIYNFNLNIL